MVRRFCDALFASPLSLNEADDVRQVLSEGQSVLFFEQPEIDQRHAYQVASNVKRLGRTDSDMLQAALLHDVGKRHSGLGVGGRVLATVLTLVRFPLTKRGAAYRDHGSSGGRELADVGSPQLVVDFAVHHGGTRPPSIADSDWKVLTRADDAPKALTTLRRRIPWF